MKKRKKSQVTELGTLPAASVRDLHATTRKRISRMKVQSPRVGISVERHPLRIDRAKLTTYRRLRAAVERNLAKKLQVEDLDSVFAAGDELRNTLVGQIRRNRALRKGR
jgi:hypothetical protein